MTRDETRTIRRTPSDREEMRITVEGRIVCEIRYSKPPGRRPCLTLTHPFGTEIEFVPCERERCENE